jgi:phage protein U
MPTPLFQLGDFQFDIPNGVPQTLERTAEYRWESQDRLLRAPAVQFLGPGNQEITLDGVLFPGFSGRQTTVENLRALAGKGEPQMLTDGNGRVWGKWSIRNLREGLGLFAPGGGARQITFSITLVKYVEDNPGQAASPLALALSSATDPFSSEGLPSFVDSASAFDATSWAKASAVGSAVQRAGFSLGQIATIAKAISNRDYVGAAFQAFGLNPLSIAQQSVWAGLGVNGLQMAQEMALGHGAPTISAALELLRPATDAMLDTLGGSQAGGNALRDMLRDAATIGGILNVDPKITAAVEQVIRQ